MKNKNEINFNDKMKGKDVAVEIKENNLTAENFVQTESTTEASQDTLDTANDPVSDIDKKSADNQKEKSSLTPQKKKIICIASIASAIVLLTAVLLIILLGGRDKPGEKTEWPAAGVYYYDVGSTRYELTLKDGGEFALSYGENLEKGKYTLSSTSLTLDFDSESKSTIDATYENGVITFTYNGISMRLIKKINYTVKFEVNGGSNVADSSVLNGKILEKPADPSKNGYKFVGWYKDSEFKVPFAFGSDTVTDNITLFARWVTETADNKEYTIRFDLGYDGAEDISSRTTIGAKIFDIPSPERNGFTFSGWWISTVNESSKLSYKHIENETIFKDDTTLFAVWTKNGSTKLEAPSLSVNANEISWNAIKNTRSYEVTITDSFGNVINSQTVHSTNAKFSFATKAAGVYEIKVVANAQTSTGDNSESFYTYINKGLDKVGGFSVHSNSILVFDTVENAEKYLITVVCGNSDHKHVDLDNSSSTNFTFSYCDMTNDGIRFTVKAVADGYLTSVSDEFVYKRELSSVEGLTYNADESVVSWGAVENAEYYMISVICGNALHTHTLINNGSKTYVDLKECSPLEDGISVKVYPVSDGYISSAASEIKVSKTNMKTPGKITFDGTNLSWDSDSFATEYEVSIDGTVHKTTSNTFDIASVIGNTQGSKHKVSVRAIGESVSAWSNPIAITNLAMSEALRYEKNTVYWEYAIGADSYEIQVGNADIINIDGSKNSAKISLYQAGENIIKVRSVNGDGRSDWVEIRVNAYSVEFDTLGGSTADKQFLAMGDEIYFPAPTKLGYTFTDWYNVSGGADTNGKKITDNIFKAGKNTTLYAYYTPQKFEITYNYGLGGEGIGTKNEVSYERDYTLEIPTPFEVTTSFGGWFSAPYGNGVQYTDSNGKSLAPWSVIGGAELHAFWIDETLSFDLVKVNGKEAYAVSAGSRISLVSEVTVPAFHNGLPVAMINGSAFANCKTLKVVNLPATIEVISNTDPFLDCNLLTDINVYSVDSINSTRYRSENGVVFECKSDGTLILTCMPMGREGSYTLPDGVSEIPTEAFKNSSLREVFIPASVLKIGNDAFLNCKNLTSVTFKESVVTNGECELTIGKRAFSGCVSLSSISLPSHLVSIELKKYSFSASGKIITDSDDAFVGCTSLSSITIAEGCKSYKSVDGMIYSADGRHLLYCPTSKSGTVELSRYTQSIGEGAFIGCNGITDVVIQSTTTYIGEYAFYNLPISTVTFKGNGLNAVTIGDNSFNGCSSLTSVIFENTSRISVIGAKAFYNCSSLKSFNIPFTVTSIRDKAFENCTGLCEVTFGASGNSLEFGKDVFYKCTSLKSITIPANVSKIPGIFGGCTALEEVKVENSPYFKSENGVIFSKDGTEIIYYPQGKSGPYDIPATVTTIANGVFSENKSITELTIPNTVSYIGEEAFKGTKIGKITFVGNDYADSLTIAKSAFQNAYFEEYDFSLPAHTKHIGEYAFAGAYFQSITLNDGLETLGNYAFYFPNGFGGLTITIPKSVTSIGEYCFAGDSYTYNYTTYECYFNVKFTKENSKLTNIGDFAFYKNPYITSVDLPESVKVIGNYAFYECKNLSELTLSSSLETIGAFAFASGSYGSGLTFSKINIPKNVSSIGANAFKYCKNLSSVTFEGTVGSPDLVIGTTYLRKYIKDGVEMFAVERGNVFSSCGKITSVILSPNVTVLGDYCFASSGATGFEITVPTESRLTTIGAYCFYKSKLVKFTVPHTVRNLEPIEEHGVTYSRLGIGEYAFAASSGYLEEIIFLTGATSYPLTIGYNAFENQSKLEAIKLPARLTSYTTADGEVLSPLANGPLVFNGATGLSDISVESGSLNHAVLGGILYTADMKEIIFCPVLVSGEVTVPSSVTKIQDYAFNGCKNITVITFSGGNEPMTIGNFAFNRCTSIKEIVLPTNVTIVSDSAFVNCSSLGSFTISKNLTSFDISALNGCSSLKNVYVEAGNSNYTSDSGILYNLNKTTLILYPAGRTETVYTVKDGVISIGQGAFLGNNVLESIILPKGLVEIKNNAFASCSALKNVVIPKSVELIGDSAFAFLDSLLGFVFEKGGTENLTIGNGTFAAIGEVSIELPARLTKIGNDAFSGAKITSLTFEAADSYRITEIGDNAFSGSFITSIVFPAGIVSVGSSAFADTILLEEIVFGEGLESIGDGAFKNSAIERISLPASLKTIGAETFYNCSSLTTFALADNAQIDRIPSGAFYGCSSLISVTIPAPVTEIGGVNNNGAFYNCSSLESVIFENNNNCILIDSYAFFGCSSLSSFELPDSVATLGKYCFAGCSSLKKITIPLTTAKLGAGAFENCTSLAAVELNTGATLLPENMFSGCTSLTYVCIPQNVTDIGKGCFANTSIERFDVVKENTGFLVVDGVIYNASKTAIVCYPPRSKNTTLFIPKEIIEIPEGNFAGCTSLKEVIFEEGGTVPLIIGEKAFDGCYQLRKIVFPERLISIGSYAFRNCYALTSVTIPKNVTEIKDFAFLWCHKLYEVYNESSIENIGSKGSLGTAQSNVNIYSPEEGKSVIFAEGDFLFATVNGTKTLIGYIGNSGEIVLPVGTYEISDYLFYYDDSITKVVIPETSGISIPGSSIFTSCRSLSAIYVKDAEAPASWNSSWNGKVTVIFGYTGENTTYTFDTNGGDEISPIISNNVITIPTPTRENYVFMGWYDNEALEGEAISDTKYYSKTDITFYASWMEKDLYEHLRYGGKSFENAFEVTSGKNQTIFVDNGGEKIYFKLKITSNAYYKITATPKDNVDPIIYVYDENGEEIRKIDTSNGTNTETTIYYFILTEGTEATYYIAFGYFNVDGKGTSTVEITKQ